MNGYDCETIRDLLPSFLRGELTPREAAAAERHLDACAECSAEAEVVELIQTSLASLPAGLEARVMSAVRQADELAAESLAREDLTVEGGSIRGRPVHPVRLLRNRPHSVSTPTVRPVPVRFALAASVAVAAIAGSVLFQQAQSPVSGTADPVAVSWAAAVDPLLHGDSELHLLSDEDLEFILAELEP